MAKRFVSVRVLAQRLGVHPETVKRYLAAGKLKAVKGVFPRNANAVPEKAAAALVAFRSRQRAGFDRALQLCYVPLRTAAGIFGMDFRFLHKKAKKLGLGSLFRTGRKNGTATLFSPQEFQRIKSGLVSEIEKKAIKARIDGNRALEEKFVAEHNALVKRINDYERAQDKASLLGHPRS